MHLHSLRNRTRARGFTLVELAIVVVVIGILSVIGGVVYRRQRAIAHSAEAKDITAGIRTAQEAYKSERGLYASISNDTSSFYPASTPGAFTTAWGAACTNCVDAEGWNKIALHPVGPVTFGYATVAGVGGGKLNGTPPPPKTPMAMATELTTAGVSLSATDPFYVTVAWGDTDADGRPCIVMSYSTSNQLVVDSEGE